MNVIRLDDVVTMTDVARYMERGLLRHAIQAGIDRANQRCVSQTYMVEQWKVLPAPFSYQVCVSSLSQGRETRVGG